MERPDGRFYIGQFVGGEQHGEGNCTWASGQRYEGGYSHGERNGHGKFTEKIGGWYYGDWYNGKQHGNGKLFDAKGDLLFEGPFVNGIRIAVPTNNG
jgi:hypothetical protein